MTNNWFSNFYGITQDQPSNNLVEKAAFAEFGREWFFQNKVAERVENGKRLYETLCNNNKEARELYDNLVTGVTGVALLKNANVRATARYPKDVDPDEVMRAGRKNMIGASSGAAVGTAGGAVGGSFLSSKRIRNPILAALAAIGTAVAGGAAGMVAGGQATRVPKHLRPIGKEKIEKTDAAPHEIKWKQYPKYQEASVVFGKQ